MSKSCDICETALGSLIYKCFKGQDGELLNTIGYKCCFKTCRYLANPSPLYLVPYDYDKRTDTTTEIHLNKVFDRMIRENREG